MPLASDASEVRIFWSNVATAIGRNGTNEETSKAVEKMFSDATCSGRGRPAWTTTMQETSNRPVGPVGQWSDEISTAVRDGRVVLVIYHRALDRFPGGNSDQHVIKHVAVLSSHDPTVSAKGFQNWDGQSYRADKISNRADVAGGFKTKVC